MGENPRLVSQLILNLQAPKSVAKQLLHCRKWSLRPHAPKAAESVASTVIDEQSLNERRSSAAQAASTPDSTHHKEVRGATETARATFNIVFVTAEVTHLCCHSHILGIGHAGMAHADRLGRSLLSSLEKV